MFGKIRFLRGVVSMSFSVLINAGPKFLTCLTNICGRVIAAEELVDTTLLEGRYRIFQFGEIFKGVEGVECRLNVK